MGCNSASVLIVNAEVDSMGGVVDGEDGIASKSSPHKATIEKVQAELRQECDVRDERKRELDFLEKGGNPLEFKLGIAATVSVQSTSIADQHPDQLVTSEAKGSLPITASPHGDSVESSGRPAATPLDPNSADNLLLFDAENNFSEGGRSLLRKSCVLQSEQSFQTDGVHKIREHGESATFPLPRKAYKRRYRSRPNRDGARSCSTDVNPVQVGQLGTSLASRPGPEEVEVLLSKSDNQKIISNPNKKPTSPSNDILATAVTENRDIELDGLKSIQSTKEVVQGVSIDTASASIAPENMLRDQINQQSISVIAEAPKKIDSNGAKPLQTEETTSAAIECQPSMTTTKAENQSDSSLMNGFGRKVRDNTMTEAMKVLDSESSCTRTSRSIDGSNDSEMCTRKKNLESNGNHKNQVLGDGTTVIEGDKFIREIKDTEGTNDSDFVNKESASACLSKLHKDSLLLPEKELDKMKDKVKEQDSSVGEEAPGHTQLESGAKPTAPLVENHGQPKETSYDIRHQETLDVQKSDLPEVEFSNRIATVSREGQTSPGSASNLACKIDEDSILKEAKIIEAKRKRIAELSVVASPVEISRKSRWDYVLEEMTWLANDFAQERIWKLASASQISYRVAVASRLRKQERSSGLDAKRVAHTLAKAVVEFWHSIELQDHETSKQLEQHCQKNKALPVRAYAVRFLKCDKANIFNNLAEVPLTPDRISDSGILDLSWEDSLTEENLFYTVAPGAMGTYRIGIESDIARYERIGSSVQEEVETSACDAGADDYVYDEDDGETNIYCMPRYGQKKRKNLAQAYGARPYEVGSDLLPMQHVENKLVNPQFSLLVKRPGSNINVSIPTKRMRTASRRAISPFGAGTSGCLQIPNKADASSCDTNSYQDDQSSLRGGSVFPNSLEVEESAGEFEKRIPFDSAEVSTRPKKKKRPKHLNAAYEHKWQVDSSFSNDQFQRGHFQKRTEIRQLESNGRNGLLGQHIAKKPKLMRQSQDNSFDNIPPVAASVPSPVGSQMSNMSNSNKFIKMLGGRDRDRKHKSLKMSSGQSGSGSLWSLFEDQALVVLAHDLGPNWELVSDAFNSTLHFKCIFRKAKECKERHICLMDRSSGDGADSADDSGSSRPYPSTLPGIPKGSARQLFQRLQGPMEEDTLKSHFEKVIMIGQKHHRKTQNDNQDPKQFQRPHSSHAIALSQVCPNNPNGGPVLTPLDLCDASISGSDVQPHGYQGAHSSGLPIQNHGTMLPASGTTAALQGASNTMIGNNFSSSSAPLNASSRSASLSADEHQRMHLYNQTVTSRNISQPSSSAPGGVPATDRGAHMLSSGGGVAMMSVANRNMPVQRSGLHAMPSSSVNMHSGVGGGQGSSMVRPREAVSMLRPGMTQDLPRQMMASDLPTPGNSQGVSHFEGLTPSFSNQTTSPPVSSYPLHHHPPRAISPQQQSHFQGQPNHATNTAYAFRLAKERQLQQRFLQQQKQQQQQFAASSMMSSVQSQPQISPSPMQNSPQLQSQTSSPQVSPSVNAKHQMPTQGVARNAQSGSSGLSSQTNKPRPRQQNQPNRQHPQQRQQLQAQQQAKIVKGVGRANPTTHHNIPTDVSLPNGVSTIPATNSMRSQGLYTGSPHQSAASPTNQTLPPSYQGNAPSVAPDSSTSSTAIVGSSNQTPPHQKSGNQTQPALQRPAQPNRQINPDPSFLPHSRDSDADHQPANSDKWRNSEPLMDTYALNSPESLSSLVSMPSNSSESVPQVGGQRPSTSLPIARQDNTAQWQQQQQSHQPQSPSLQFQQPVPLLHSQQQAQLSGNLYGRSSDTRLE